MNIGMTMTSTKLEQDLDQSDDITMLALKYAGKAGLSPAR